jgi:hypothetical protein
MSMSRLASLGLACLVSGACTVIVQPAPQGEPEPEPEPNPRVVKPEPEPPPRPTPVRRTAPELGIPPGHFPDPGYCRVWIEGRPPGQQARARACQGILPYAGEGTFVLYRPIEYQRELWVRYVHQTKPGVIVAVRVFDARNGRYLRDMPLAEDDDNMRPGSEMRQPTPVRRRPQPELTPPPTRRGNSGVQADTTKTNRGNRGNSGVQADTTRSNRGNVGNQGNRGNSGVQADTTKTNRGNRGNPGVQADTTRSNRGNAGNQGNRGNSGVQADTTKTNRGNRADTTRAGGAGQQGRRGGDEERGRQADEPPPRRPGDDTPLGSASRVPLEVDPGYFPRAGQCRVWLPERPAAQQPRMSGCNGIARRAPAGAWILRRTRNEPGVIFVDYIDSDNGGVVVKTSAYDAATGRFIRDEPQR